MVYRIEMYFELSVKQLVIVVSRRVVFRLFAGVGERIQHSIGVPLSIFQYHSSLQTWQEGSGIASGMEWSRKPTYLLRNEGEIVADEHFVNVLLRTSEFGELFQMQVHDKVYVAQRVMFISRVPLET